jgi:hypothetical protein
LPKPERAPSIRVAPKAPPRSVRGAFDIELLDARRRIAALELDRAGAKAAVNELLVRSWEREGRLAEATQELANVSRAFLEHIEAEIERVHSENAGIDARLVALRSHWLCRLGAKTRAPRTFVQKLRRRLRRRAP